MAILAYPFRIFFIAAAALAAAAIPFWLYLWHRGAIVEMALSPLHWHAHEMLAGFLNAAVAGFILTAVCAWTGTRPVAGSRLGALFGLWLAARALLLAGGAAAGPGIVLDLAFLPAVTAVVAYRVWAARQPRHFPLVLVLLALWGCDAAFHLSGDAGYLRALLPLAALLILIIGGRITPAFSSNWLRLHGGTPEAVRSRAWLDNAVMILAALLALCQLLQLRGIYPAVIAALAAAAVMWRLAGWRGWLVRSEPLLWVLHVGQLWIAAGFLLWAAAAMDRLPDSAWVHALGAGAAGTMILGVMTRVAMGHTGRPLQLVPGMTIAYCSVIASGLLRVATSLGWLGSAGLWGAAALWSLAFGLFVVRYTPILAAPRIDGGPG